MKRQQTLAKIKIPLLLGGLFGAAIAVVFYARQAEPPPLEFDNSQGIVVISPPIHLPDITLTNHHNQPFASAEFKGRWNLLFFGFTHCPDICPTTLATMNQVAKQLPPAQTGYFFISLDPRRDTPEKLRDYVSYFNPQFVALTGSQNDIHQLSEKLGVVYDYEGDTNTDQYTLNHYSAILVVDPQGRLRAHILPPHPVGKVVEAVNKISQYYGN